MGAFHGLWANGRNLGPRPRLLEWVERAQPGFMLVCDDDDRYTLCQEIDHLSPNTVIEHRSTWLGKPGENEPWKAGVGPEKWVAHIRATNPPPYVRHSLFCEAGHDQEHHDYMLKAMPLASARDLPLAIGGWSTGSYFNDEGTLDNESQYDEIFHMLDYFGGFHSLDIHEYEQSITPYCTAGGFVEVVGDQGRSALHLEQRELLQKPRWTTPTEFLELWRGNRHIGRVAYIIYRWEKVLKLSLDNLRIGIGETGWDDLTDIPLGIRQRIAARGNVPLLRGMPTLGDYWKWVFPDWTMEQTAAEMVIHVAKLYRAFNKQHRNVLYGAALYDWNYIEGEQSEKYNQGEYTDYLEAIADERGEEDEEVQPPTEPPIIIEEPEKPVFPLFDDLRWQFAVVSRTGSRVNVRVDHSTRAAILGQIDQPLQVKVLQAESVTEDDELWIPIRLGQDYILPGWIAAQYVKIDVDPLAPIRADVQNAAEMLRTAMVLNNNALALLISVVNRLQ